MNLCAKSLISALTTVWNITKRVNKLNSESLGDLGFDLHHGLSMKIGNSEHLINTLYIAVPFLSYHSTANCIVSKKKHLMITVFHLFYRTRLKLEQCKKQYGKYGIKCYIIYFSRDYGNWKNKLWLELGCSGMARRNVQGNYCVIWSVTLTIPWKQSQTYGKFVI